MIGLILAAGNGSRLSPTGSCCKTTVSVADKALIEYSLDNFSTMNIEKVVIVVGKYRDEIYEVVGDFYAGMQIIYAEQKSPKGLVNAIMSAYSHIAGEDVVLQLGDELFIDCKPIQLKEYFFESGANFICTYTYEEDSEQIKNNYSLRCDAAGTVEDCIEKPLTIDNHMKGTGFCVFEAGCIALLNETYDYEANYPNDLCELMKLFIRCGKKGKTFCIARQELNINTIENLKCANEIFSEERKKTWKK